MKSALKPLVLAGLLAGFGLTAVAQSTPTAPAMGSAPAQAERMAPRDPARMQERMARMQERMAKRQAAFKAKLQITPAQENAWSVFTAALQPAANRPQRPSRAEFEKLTTPERIDRMRAMKAERDARMLRRGDATKTFYAALTPEQQKVFDSESLRSGRHQHGRPGHHHGPRRG